MTSVGRTHESRSVRSGTPPANSHRNRGRRTRDRAGKQGALIQAALKLFATKGYEATTTREIAASAHCAEGLIHRYFGGKAGLLSALIEHQFFKEIADLGRELQPASNFQAEFIQLVDWEVERFWQTQDLRKVLISRSFVDPTVAQVMKRSGISVRSEAILERLQRYPCCSSLPREQLEVLAQAVGMLGLVFGFMRPLVLGQDRVSAKRMALTVARMLVRGATSSAGDQFS